MKTFFTVKQADDTESYSGRFNVSNEELDICTEGYDLEKAIDEFITKFKNKYCYWHNVYDSHLNEESLADKNEFMSYEKCYKKC